MTKSVKYYEKKIAELAAKLARYKTRRDQAWYNKLPQMMAIDEINRKPHNVWKALMACKKWKKPHD